MFYQKKQDLLFMLGNEAIVRGALEVFPVEEK
jgi:hypothetical protein